MIVGVFLAAGAAKRFGSDKLLYEFKGEPLFSHSLRACLASLLPKIYVILGPGSTGLERAIRRLPDDSRKLILTQNPNPERGLMSSLKTGLRRLSPSHEAAMVVLADMPFVTAEIINALLSAFDKGNGIVVPECDGELYHPRLIPRRLFTEFLRLDDKQSGMKVLRKFAGDVVGVRIGDRRSYIDIDNLEDVEGVE
jgi:molybdenum cofactor cytidylyltransferase